MNEILQVIKERRSIRVFKDEQIKDEELNEVLQAGLYAPSAMNQQSWHFTVIQNDTVLENFTQTAKDTYAKSGNDQLKGMSNNYKYKVFYNAPTAILISGDINAANPQADCAAATENILLAAQALGLGACWIGSMPYIFGNGSNEALKKELEIPDGYNPIYSIALGYAASENAHAPVLKANKINIIK